MKDNIFDISFEQDGKNYKGWVNPSEKLSDTGTPVSFHVVLNDVSFGHLAFQNCNWTTSEERPSNLVKAIGKEIERYFKL